MRIKSLTELLECDNYESVTEIIIYNDTVNDDVFQLIYKCTNVKKIKTFETYTKDIPSGIKALQNLEILIIIYNIGIINITEELYELINLKYLDISNNGLKTLSSNINKLINLKYLNISSNRIYDIPKEIGDLQSLKELHICMDTALCIITEKHINDGMLIEINDIITMSDSDIVEPVNYLPSELCKLKFCKIKYDPCRINKHILIYEDAMIILSTLLNFHLKSDDLVFTMPDNIKYLTTYDTWNTNFNNLPICLEYLTIFSATGCFLKKNKLYNLPPLLKSLKIYKNIPSEVIDETDINLPFGCELTII